MNRAEKETGEAEAAGYGKVKYGDPQVYSQRLSVQHRREKGKELLYATKGRQVMIFPGSGLFKQGGTGSLLRRSSKLPSLCQDSGQYRSRLAGRGRGDLCRSTYAEPHWEKNRGEVVALEQVSLFGLVIIPGRPVSYGRIDPDTSSHIFIRGALIEGNVRQTWPFLIHNRKLMEKVSTMEDKIRRHDLLADEEQISCSMKSACRAFMMSGPSRS